MDFKNSRGVWRKWIFNKIGAVNEAQNSFCVMDAGCDATLVCEHMHDVTSEFL